jgi:glutamate 5-kinase
MSQLYHESMSEDSAVRKRIVETVCGAKRIVVKVGTAVVTDDRGYLDHSQIDRIADQIGGLLRQTEVLVVSSGAIGAGMGILGMVKRPSTLPELQAAAAVGQGHLMQAYSGAFEKRGFHAAQVLLTQEDFDDRRRYLNVRNTLNALAGIGVVPVINENDTVSVDEIRFSDNDILAALVTNLTRADLLIILTNVDGLYDGDPSAGSACVMCVVENINDELKRYVAKGSSRLGRGGMASKLEAASMAAAAGEMVVIANGRTDDVLTNIVKGGDVGTVILPAVEKMASKKRWIGFTAKPKGDIVVDKGAENAVKNGKSLLPSGIVDVQGRFREGDVVSIRSASGSEFARGLTNYPSAATRKIKGLRTSEIKNVLGEMPYEEVVRRENLVILDK